MANPPPFGRRSYSTRGARMLVGTDSGLHVLRIEIAPVNVILVIEIVIQPGEELILGVVDRQAIIRQATRSGRQRTDCNILRLAGEICDAGI